MIEENRLKIDGNLKLDSLEKLKIVNYNFEFQKMQ